MKAAGSLHEFLVKLHARFGPIASFYWSDMHVVSVASPIAFRQLEHIFDRACTTLNILYLDTIKF